MGTNGLIATFVAVNYTAIVIDVDVAIIVAIMILGNFTENTILKECSGQCSVLI